MSRHPLKTPLRLLPDDPLRLGVGKVDAQHVEIVAHGEPGNVAAEPFKNIETVAFVVNQPRDDFKLTPIILDEVRDDEVLVEMKYSGIFLQQGLLPMVEFPAVFGHEGAGIVRAIGGAVRIPDLKVGDAVALSFNTCGTCKPCSSDNPAFCHAHPAVNHNAVRLSDRSTPGRSMDGRSIRTQYFGQSSFSKMSVINEKCVVKCPHPENLHLYAPLGCGFQTGAGTVLNVLKPSLDDSMVIFGLGSVGLAALMAASHLGVSNLIAVDIMPSRLELARELGATETLNSRNQPDIVAAIKKLTCGGATFAVDCTGIPKVLEDTIDCIGPLGTAALVGVSPAGAKIQLNPLEFLLENKKLVGVVEGGSNPRVFIPELIELHQAGNFPIERLCKKYHYSELPQAVKDMNAGKVIKPVIEWS
ncbi:hypothetical protein Neosp_012709 [[Neocosmospora] mangrovei]